MPMNMMKSAVAAACLAAMAAPALAGSLTGKIAAKYTVKSTDVWYGGERTVFDFKGYDAWVVEPPKGVDAQPGRPWTWTMQWRTAFVPRTSVPRLLKAGWCHVSVDIFRHRMDAAGLKVAKEFQDFLVGDLGFAPKARLIGMSWGGFFSTRYAANYPACVERIYLDAPLLCFTKFTKQDEKTIGPWAAAAPADGNWDGSPEMPINLAGKIAAAKIPVLLLYGGVDPVVPPEKNSLVFADRFRKAGGDIKVVARKSYAHHPHGVEESDNTIIDFFSEPAAAGPSVLTIPDTPFGKFEVAVPVFAARDFPITDFGAKEGEKATEAFARAMAECERSGGGRVVVPKGKWLTGAVRFRDNCDLHLSEGATLEFTDDPADYPEVHTSWEGIECLNHSPLLYAYCVTNVAITGKGLIAPRMGTWNEWCARPPEHMKATEHLYYWCSTNAPVSARRLLALDRAHMRPHLIQFNRCGNVLLEDFRVRESPFWMIHLYHSENCVVRRLKTFAHGHNNDGVDVEMTRNVLIENCSFDQGDDGVVLKAGRNADGWRLGRCTENVVVRDCDLKDCHSLLGIGSELSGGVRNVWITRCSVSDTYSMLRIKTGPRRGGFVENVWMDHCAGSRMIRVFNIFTAYTAQWGRFPDFELRRTRIRNVNISDCTARLAAFGIQLGGDPLLPPSGIRISNVKIGRVINSMTDISECYDVRIDGLELAPEGTVSFTPNEFVAEGGSAEAFAADGSWRKVIGMVKPGDRVVLRFPPSPQRDAFARHVREQGGSAVVQDR